MNRIISFCAALWIISLLGFLTVMIVSFSYPNSSIGDLFGNRQRNLTIGIIFYKQNEIPRNKPIDQSLLALNERILNITLAAINDINDIVVNQRSLNNFMTPKVKTIIFYSLNCQKATILSGKLRTHPLKIFSHFYNISRFLSSTEYY